MPVSVKRGLGMAGLALGSLAVPLLAAHKIVRRSVPVSREPERTKSYWMATIPELPCFPRLEDDITVDVAVVGGGWTGLATAYYVKTLDPSLTVALLESHRLGSGASSRNSGGALPRFRGHAPTEQSLRGYELLKAFCETQGVDVELQESVPILRLHRSRAASRQPKMVGEELHREIGSEFYDAADLTYSNRLHPGKLIAGLVEANRRAGVALYEHSPVTRIDRSVPPRLETPRGRVVARDVVLATNGYTPGLGIARDRIISMHHRVIATRPLTDGEWEHSGLERWPFRLETGGYYTHTVRGTSDRRFFYRHVLGHRAFEETHWDIDDRIVSIGRRELLRRYPWLDGVPIDYEWHGITGRTRDWWPVTGQIDKHLYIAAGYNGSGAMATHYFGHLLAHSIVGKPHQDLDLLKPPSQHPCIPGEFLRHLFFQGWMEYERFRDGRQ